MRARIAKAPIAFSVISTMIIGILFHSAYLLFPSDVGDTSRLLLDSGVRVIFVVPCIILLGYVLEGGGFRFSFAVKGFAKGLFACSAIFLFMLTMVLKFLIAAEMRPLSCGMRWAPGCLE